MGVTTEISPWACVEPTGAPASPYCAAHLWAPRLRETGGGERERGGIGLRGAGESSVELDRCNIRDRISELKTELAAITTRRHDGRGVRRRCASRWSGTPTRASRR